MEKWKARIKNWVLDSINSHPVHIVRYENMRSNTTSEVAKMLSFLHIPFNKVTLADKLQNDFTTFKRKHTSDNFEHLSSSQKQHIKSVLIDTIELAESANLTNILGLKDYLL